MKFTKQKKIRGIYIRLYGGSYASWTELVWFDFRCNNKNLRRSITANEEHLNEKAYFLGDCNGSRNEAQPLRRLPCVFKMSPGTHSYTFECMLPSDLPTSVEGKHGHIRYIASIVVDGIHSGKKIFDVPFTVIRPFDLNCNSELRVIYKKNIVFIFLLSKTYNL